MSGSGRWRRLMRVQTGTARTTATASDTSSPSRRQPVGETIATPAYAATVGCTTSTGTIAVDDLVPRLQRRSVFHGTDISWPIVAQLAPSSCRDRAYRTMRSRSG